MLPTPRASDGPHGGPGQTNGRGEPDSLPAIAALLPTPTSQAAKHGELSPVERDGNRPQDNGNLWVVLPRLAEGALLPTPAVNDMGEGKTTQDWDAWTDKMKAAHGNGNGHGRSLAIEAQRLLPTPQASDLKGANLSGSDSQPANGLSTRALQLLGTPTSAMAARSQKFRDSSPNPAEIAEQIAGGATVLIGANTPPPSPDGSESSDVPLPFPPSQGEPGHHDSLPPSSSG